MGDLVSPEAPEAAHLAEQEIVLAELAETLAERESELEALEAEFTRFRLWYQHRFAPLYAELDHLEWQIARLKAEAEQSAAAFAAATAAQSKAEESARAQADADQTVVDDVEAERQRAVQDPELKSLYRDAAKQIHPDLAADDAERARRTVLMAMLNAAYEAGDPEAIRAILDREAARPEAIFGDDVLSRLGRTLRKISQARTRLVELERLIDTIKADPMFELFRQGRDSRRAGLEPFPEVEADLRRRIEAAAADLAALQGVQA